MPDDIEPGDVPPVVIPNWVLFHINMLANANEMQYTWSYRSSTNVVSPTTLNGFCQDLWTAIVGQWQTAHNIATALQSITAETRYPSGANYTGLYLAPSTTLGARNSPILPGNVALAISKLSGVRGRKYNGRMFLTSIGEADAAGDLADNAYAAAAIAFAAKHLLSMTRDSVVLSPGVASRAGGFVTEFNRVRLGTILDSQRRRLTGRGS